MLNKNKQFFFFFQYALLEYYFLYLQCFGLLREYEKSSEKDCILAGKARNLAVPGLLGHAPQVHIQVGSEHTLGAKIDRSNFLTVAALVGHLDNLAASINSRSAQAVGLLDRGGLALLHGVLEVLGQAQDAEVDHHGWDHVVGKDGSVLDIGEPEDRLRGCETALEARGEEEGLLEDVEVCFR